MRHILQGLHNQQCQEYLLFWLQHQPQFLLLFMLIVLVNFLSQIPYFNIFLSPRVMLILFWIISVMLFRLTGKTSIVVSLILLVFAPIFLIFNREDVAEQIGNLVYFLLLTGFIQDFTWYIIKVKQRNKE